MASLESALAPYKEIRAINVVHINDYEGDDQAQAEVEGAVSSALKRWEVRHRHSFAGRFNTLSCGFQVAAFGLAPAQLRPPNTLVYLNVAPRRGNGDGARKGEPLVLAQLRNGVLCLGPSAGFSYSFVAPEVKAAWELDVDEDGRQFRSRDCYPRALAELLGGLPEEPYIQKIRATDLVVPEVPVPAVARLDRPFGNIKLTLSTAHPLVQTLEPGQQVKVCIGQHRHIATFSTGSFKVREGVLALSVGSTTIETSHGTTRFLELFQVGGTAAEMFQRPESGTPVEIEV